MRKKLFLLPCVLLSYTVARAQNSFTTSDSLQPLPMRFFYTPVFDTLPLNQLPVLINSLALLPVKNGNIYCSGTNSSNIVSVMLNGGTGGIKTLFAKCTSGSKITLEKFIVILSNGEKKEINKSIF